MTLAKISLSVFLGLIIISLSSPLPVRAEELTNSLGMKFVLIPAGTFAIAAELQRIASLEDNPERRVTLTKPFYLGVYEVTQAQWAAVMGDNPSEFKGDSHPVEMISWDDAAAFVDKLNQTRNEGTYRLPTEAEWEFSMLAGTTAANFWGDNQDDNSLFAWHSGNSGDGTHPVGETKPNPWGLYDILGNVDEWVSGWAAENYYGDGPYTDPPGATNGTERVNRGGSWGDWGNKSFYRQTEATDESNHNWGLRLVFEPTRTKRLLLRR
ncbi:MAG: formylglycine-generating enzyme family protein [Deltaproteobacteria bacterium]|jgi:formylglycine-generating enzyme required for sulfatase activity|nr:formylglycine-generating enzyme family protein [Deltaproteobacteria bacterium]